MNWLKPSAKHYLLCILLAALSLRLYHLSQQSLWFDEWLIYISLLCDNFTHCIYLFLILVPEMAITPLYLAASFLQSTIFGTQVPVLRLLSLIPGVLSVFFIFLLGRKIAGNRCGLIAALCLALSPQHIWHNQEIRPYSLLFLFCIVSLLGLINWRETSRRRWFLLNCIANACVISSHLFGVLFLLPQGFYLLQRRELKAFSIWAGTTLVFVLPLLVGIVVAPYVSEGYLDNFRLPLAFLVFNVFPKILFNSLVADVLRWHPGINPSITPPLQPTDFSYASTLSMVRPVLDWTLTLLILGCIAWFVLHGASRWLPSQKSGRRKTCVTSNVSSANWTLLTTLIFVPSGILAILTMAFSTNFSDYGHDIYATIGIYIGIGASLTSLPRGFRRIGVVSLVLLYGFQCILLIPNVTRSNWQDAAEFIKENAAENGTVLDFWWRGPGTYRIPYFADTSLTFRRVSTPLAICDQAAAVIAERQASGSPAGGETGVWVFLESGTWSLWFPKDDIVHLVERGLQSRGLASRSREFPGGYAVAVMHIYPLTGTRPEPGRDLSPGLWTCDYDSVLADIGLGKVCDARREQMLYTLERTVAVWPAQHTMARFTYPVDLLLAHDLELAEAMARHMVLENPSFGLGYLNLAFIWAAQGNDHRALAAAESAYNHHLGLRGFFEEYFIALCEKKDADAARAALPQIQKLLLPLFHDTAASVIEMHGTAKPAMEADTQSPGPERVVALPCTTNQERSAHPLPETLTWIWEDPTDISSTLPWIFSLFERQEHPSRLTHWMPFRKLLVNIPAEFRFWLTGNTEAAVAHFSDLIRQFPFEKRFYDRYDTLVLRLNNSERYLGDWLEFIQRNPEIAPHALKTLAEEGRNCFIAGKNADAILLYEAVCAGDTPDYIHALRLAYLYSTCSLPDQSLHWYGKVLRSHPFIQSAAEQVDLLLQENKDAAATVAFWKGIFENRPEEYPAAMRYAQAQETMGDYESAVEVYRAAKTFHPDRWEIPVALGRCLTLAGAFADAFQTLSEIQNQDDTAQPLVAYEYIRLGQAYVRENNAASAAPCFEAAIRLGHHTGLAYYHLGHARKMTGEASEALACFRRAVESDPENSWFLRVLAQYEDELGMFQNAISDYQQVLRQSPQDVEVIQRLNALLNTHHDPETP